MTEINGQSVPYIDGQTTIDDELPPGDQLADEHDEAGWDHAVHGSFAEYAEPDDAVPTVSGDEYLDAG